MYRSLERRYCHPHHHHQLSLLSTTTLHYRGRRRDTSSPPPPPPSYQLLSRLEYRTRASSKPTINLQPHPVTATTTPTLTGKTLLSDLVGLPTLKPKLRRKSKTSPLGDLNPLPEDLLSPSPLQTKPRRKTKKATTVSTEDVISGSEGLTSTSALNPDPTTEEGELGTEVGGVPNSKLLQTVIEYQSAYPQYIALIRVGDFYELYYDQADLVGDLLGLLVVDKKLKGQLIRFTGFPYTQLERHLETLVNRHGRCVAVLEQFQDPISKQYDRRVDRIFTPGTLIGEQFLDSTQANYLLALFFHRESGSPPPGISPSSSAQYLKEDVGMAWIDLATGDFQLGVTFKEELPTELARLKPREIVLPTGSPLDPFNDSVRVSEEPLPTFHQAPHEGGYLEGQLRILQDFSSLEQQAGLGLLNYIVKTQGGRDLNLQLPVSRDDPRRLKIDPAVLKCLEINSPKTKSTLLAHLNNTITKAGSRLLAKRLASPSTHIPTIETRLDLIDAFRQETNLALKLKKSLLGARDAQRSLQKISLGHESPQDVIDILSMLNCSRELKAILKTSPFGIIRDLSQHLKVPKSLAEAINNALDCEVPRKTLGKGVIKSECNVKLTRLHDLFNSLEKKRDALENTLKLTLGTRTLKLVSSGGLGYFLEISQRDSRFFLANQTQLTSTPLLFQDLKGKKRYYLKEWTELASQLDQVEAEILEEEKEIFRKICHLILSSREEIIKNCQIIAEIDVATSLAQTAQDLCLVRPKLSATPKLNITAARHLSVEIALHRQRRQFTPNDCHLDASPELSDHHPTNPGRLWIITGPNMGGKTTFLRQIASIIILAQSGFPVPADAAEIGIVDQIFSRVGSADNLVQEQSTFMVEMQEMSNILRKATYRSLIIADEIGRGTSTHEGEAIAFAILHYLHHRIRCRTLFATHFHRLAQATSLPDSSHCLPAARNHHTRVVTLEDDQFAFLHDLLPGASTSSSATLVAHLAGIPPEVIALAHTTLQTNPFEVTHPAPSSAPATTSSDPYQPLLTTLQATDLDHVTPVDALLLLRRLQHLLPPPQ